VMRGAQLNAALATALNRITTLFVCCFACEFPWVKENFKRKVRMHVARERVLGASPSDGHTQGVTRPGDAGSGSADLELPTCSGGCAWSAPAARNTNLIDAFSVAHDLAGTKEIDRAARRPEPDTCPEGET
jgi:hypothetical protein